MKLNKILVMSCLIASIACTTQAAVIEGTTQSNENVLFESIASDIENDVLEVENQTEEVQGIKTVATIEETKLREVPSPTGDIIGYLNSNEEIIAIERYGDFYKVITGDNKVGYVYKTQIDTTSLEDITDVTPKKDEVQEAKSKGEEIVETAKQYIGGKYVYGGNNLATGVDCSGFTQQITKLCGIKIERTSRSQYASSGVEVSVSNILPGDLVFYGKNGVTVDHVAIYAGNNQIIHASDSRSGIKVSKLYYGKPIIGVKRVTN